MTDANMMLEPCPFCGGEAKCNGHPKGILGQIYCSNEKCFGPRTTAFTKQDSIIQWNTRAAATPPPQREEIAREILEAFLQEVPPTEGAAADDESSFGMEWHFRSGGVFWIDIDQVSGIRILWRKDHKGESMSFALIPSKIEPDDPIKDASDLLKQYIEETKAAGNEPPMAIYHVMHALSYAMRARMDSGIICVHCGKPAVGKCEGSLTDEQGISK